MGLRVRKGEVWDAVEHAGGYVNGADLGDDGLEKKGTRGEDLSMIMNPRRDESNAAEDLVQRSGRVGSCSMRWDEVES